MKKCESDIITGTEDIYYGTPGSNPLRRYVLDYKTGTFGKTRLSSITQFGSGGQLFNTHEFDYYEDASEGTIFGNESGGTLVEMFNNLDGLGIISRIFEFFSGYIRSLVADEWGSVLSRSETDSVSGFISAWLAPMSLLKADSFGITAGAGSSEGRITDSLIDIDGDGLPDIVYASRTGARYRRNLGNNSFSDPVEIAGLSNIGTDSSYNIYGGPELPQSIPVNLNLSFSKQYGKGYFTDVNGDGLVDYVSGDGIRAEDRKICYNNTKNNGNPVFATTPPGYEVLITSAGDGESVDLGGADNGSEPTRTFLHEKFYLDDPLRIWRAPFTGVVSISGDVKIAANSKPSGSTYVTDGVKVYIQKNDRLLWSDEIKGAEIRTPQGVSEIFVEKGDEIIFRVNSIDDGAYDVVDWDPLIAYTSEGDKYKDEVDENGKYIYRFQASTDFSLFGIVNLWCPPMDGKIRIRGRLNKGVTSDKIKISVMKYKKTSAAGSTDVITEIPIDEYESASVIENREFDITVDEAVKKSSVDDNGIISWEEFVLVVSSETPVDPGIIDIKASICYVSNTEGIEFRDAEGNDSSTEQQRKTVYWLNPSYNNFRPLIESQPNTPWKAKTAGMVHVTYGVETLDSAPFVITDGNDDPDVEVTIAVKKNGVLIDKITKKIGDSADVDQRAELSLDIPVEINDRIYFVLSSKDKNYRQNLQIWVPTITYTDPETLETVNEHHYACEYEIRDFDTRFGGGYRNWYYARWCGNDNDLVDRSKMLEINEANLEAEGFKDDESGLNDQQKVDQRTNNANVTANMIKRYRQMVQSVQLVKEGKTLLAESPLKEAFYDPGTKGGWFGNDRDCWITGERMSSTRIVQKNIGASSTDEGNKYGYAPAAQTTDDAQQFEGGVIVKKVTDSWDYCAGVSSGAYGGSVSAGKKKTTRDYFDINGDRYPDIVSSNTIQCTRPDGKLGRPYGYGGMGVNVSRTFSNTHSYSFTLSSKSSMVVEIGNGYIVNDFAQETTSYSVSLVNSSVISAAEFTDMNGDGLPDYLYIDGEDGDIFSIHGISAYYSGADVNVAYSTGYAFTGARTLASSDFISRTELLGGTPVKVGMNWDSNRYSAGASVGITNSRLMQCYMDLNGDGLPDRVKIDGTRLKVRYNTGNGFTSEYDQPVDARCISSTVNNSSGVSGSASLSATIWIPFTAFYFTIGGTGGASGEMSNNLSISEFRDMNGDGLTDIVLNDSSGGIKTVLNKIGRTNLLKTITNPLGGKIEIDYKRTANDETNTGNTYDNPGTKYVMSYVKVTDNNEHSYKYNYDYANGGYDRGEREFLGFGKVTATMPDKSTVETLYHGLAKVTRIKPDNTTEEIWDPMNIYRKGLVKSQTVKDTRGDIYTVTEKFYTDRETGTPNSYFIQLYSVRTDYYEGSGTPQISSVQEYSYDSYGNVSKFEDLGDITTSADDVTADIVYEYRNDTYLMALPVRITVTSDGALLRQRTGTYDTKGNLRTVTQVSGNDASTTTMDYDEYGNIILVTYPPNERSQCYSLRYTYDQAVQTYPSSVTDSFGLSSSTKYDVKYGVPIVTTDTNGSTMYYYYDAYGRMTRVVGPYDAGSYTISFSYEISNQRGATRCITRNKGYYMDSDSVDTIVTIDAMKRVISTAVTSEVNGAAGYTVSGAVEYDEMGRVTHQGQPRYNTTGAPVVMENPTITTYDSIGRKTRVEMPDGTDISMDYAVSSYAGRSTLVTTVTDQMGRERTTHKDVRDNILAVTDPNGATTTYSYSTLGEIQKVRDAAGNETTMKYDGFGRRTEINNPDTGRTQFTYDSAGNLTRKITAELNAKGKAIRYHYDHNRLVQVDYPFMDDVYYTYGSSGSGYNRAGRVYRVDNGTVSEELYFGKLGETIKSIKTIKDGTVSTSYTTKYTFDNLGRMRTLTYPDGEILTYNYGKGGLLKSAIGETKTGRTVYLENMQYDVFGQRTYVKYGNGAESTYTYEPVMRRLQNLKTTSSDGKTLQNITYLYDKVGNITNRNNNGFNTNDDVSRNSEQSYEYDEMDRLTGSSGKFDYETWNPFWDKRVNTYTSQYNYSTTGKMLHKTQENKGLLQETNETVTIAETTYDWSYEYTGAHPNAVTKAGPRTYSYDLNGNMTQMTVSPDSPLTPGGGTASMTRTLAWDDENRLLKTTDKSGTNENVTSYSYDASGMRALKKGKYGTVQYVSDNYTVRNKDLISKHVFAGNTRLVSKTVMQEEKSGKMTTTEQGAYYYHADHLGSSSVVTDKAGKFYEQIEYFPYGETWINNKANSEQTSSPYKFTAKEYDEETGLYYYGARYYDAKLSRWCSADPPLARGDYLPVPSVSDKAKQRNANLPGMGGVFNSINIDAYHYAGQNPVLMVDPDGNAFISVVNGKTKYIAANRVAQLVKAEYNMLPVFGSEIFKFRCYLGDLYDLSDDSVVENLTGKALDITSLSMPKKIIGKIASGIDNLCDVFSIASALSVEKAEFVIEQSKMFDGKDKEFIAMHAKSVESEIAFLIEKEQINVKGDFWESKQIFIDDPMNYLQQIRAKIENEYKQYEYYRDYTD